MHVCIHVPQVPARANTDVYYQYDGEADTLRADGSSGDCRLVMERTQQASFPRPEPVQLLLSCLALHIT